MELSDELCQTVQNFAKIYQIEVALLNIWTIQRTVTSNMIMNEVTWHTERVQSLILKW